MLSSFIGSGQLLTTLPTESTLSRLIRRNNKPTISPRECQRHLSKNVVSVLKDGKASEMRGRVKIAASLIGRTSKFLTFRTNFNFEISPHFFSFKNYLISFPRSQSSMTDYPSHFSTYTAVNNRSYWDWNRSYHDRNLLPGNLFLSQFENPKVTNHVFQFEKICSSRFPFFLSKIIKHTIFKKHFLQLKNFIFILYYILDPAASTDIDHVCIEPPGSSLPVYSIIAISVDFTWL